MRADDNGGAVSGACGADSTGFDDVDVQDWSILLPLGLVLSRVRAAEHLNERGQKALAVVQRCLPYGVL